MSSDDRVSWLAGVCGSAGEGSGAGRTFLGGGFPRACAFDPGPRAEHRRWRYDGGFAIEPHVATVFHVEDGQKPDWEQCYKSYVDYGRRVEDLMEEIGWEPQPFE